MSRRLVAPLIAALLVGVLPVSVARAAVDRSHTVPIDGQLTISLQRTTVDTLSATFAIVTPPDHGDLSSIGPTDCGGTYVVCVATVQYTPDPGYEGPDSFVYSSQHGVFSPSQATVSIDVAASNDAPVAGDSCVIFREDDPAAIASQANLFSSDTSNPLPSDPNGDSLIAEPVTLPTTGTMTLRQEGTVAYAPAPDAWSFQCTGPTFQYLVNDGNLDSATVTADTWIIPVNDPPTFTPGANVDVDEDSGAYDEPWATAISAGPNEAAALQVVSFDVDAADTSLFAVQPAIGANGRLTFTPAANANGSTTVTVTASDDGGTWSDSAGTHGDPTADPVQFTIAIDAVNNAPVAVDDPDDTLCDWSDFGSAHPIPEDWSGGTQGWESYFWFVDGLPCALLANDTDADGDDLTFEIMTDPTHGEILEDGITLGYDPDPDFSTIAGDEPGGEWASDTITYRAFDGVDYSEPATLSVWIAPINDAPTFTPGSNVAVDEDNGAYSSAWATAVSPGPGASEAGQTVTFQRTNMVGTGGLFSVAPAISSNGNLTFTPAADKNGAVSVTFRAVDDGGTANPAPGFADPADDTSDSVTFDITVDGVDDDPVAGDDSLTVLEDAQPTLIHALDNDDDVDSDTLDITGLSGVDATKGSVAIIQGGSLLRYTPADDAFGSDTFMYTIDDGDDGTDTGSVTVTITPVNDVPTADGESLTVAEDAGASAVPVLTGDADIDGDALAITATTNGTKGTVAITGGGTGLTYRPGANKTGSDSFTYTISDGHGGTATATVTVTIAPSNDAPSAVNDGAPTVISIPAGGPFAIPVLGNDTDPDGDALTITSKTNGAKGTVAITGGGTGLTYDPAALATGTDTFAYTVRDAHGLTDTATVLVKLLPDTAAPVLSGLTERFPTHTIGASSVHVRLAWAGADPGSSLVSYQLQVSVNSGAYANVPLSGPTATTVDRTMALTTGAEYRFRIRATDAAGNTSAYRSWPVLKPVRYQETTSRATYTGSWSTSTSVNMSGGGGKFASSATRSVRFSFTGRDVAWVTSRFTSSGQAAVYVDGAKVATVDLDTTATAYRRLVFGRDFVAGSGAHTLEIRPLGDGRVDIDAFLILR